MRLPLLARDYTQSFPNYKGSEGRTLRIGSGKPPVLISHCRHNMRICKPSFSDVAVHSTHSEDSAGTKIIEGHHIQWQLEFHGLLY